MRRWRCGKRKRKTSERSLRSLALLKPSRYRGTRQSAPVQHRPNSKAEATLRGVEPSDMRRNRSGGKFLLSLSVGSGILRTYPSKTDRTEAGCWLRKIY